MAVITNLTNLSNAKNFYDLLVYTNDITGSLVGLLFLLTLFIILLIMTLRKYDDEPEKAFFAASFVTFGLSIFMSAMRILNFWYILAFGLIWGASGLWVWFNKP